MINKISKNDCSSLINDLIKKITLVLINSRSHNHDNINKIDKTFLLFEERNNEYLDDFFNDDYGKKKQSYYLFFLEFYYHRQGFKCLLEKWTINYSTLLKEEDFQSNWQKSAIFIRSIYSLSRLLPCYSINKIKEKDERKLSGKINYRLYLNENNIDRFPGKTVKIFNMKIENDIIKTEIKYLSKEDFVRFDNDHMNANIKTDIPIKQRQRHFSLDEKMMKPLYKVMAGYQQGNINFIDEDYFSNDSESSSKHIKNNNSTYNKAISNDISNKNRRTSFFGPISDRQNINNPLNTSLGSSSSSSCSHSSNNSFQLDIIACNEESQEEKLNKINLVLKDKKQSMNNLQLDTKAKDDWIEIISEGINENIRLVVSNFFSLKTIIRKRSKITKMNVVNLTQLYKCFLFKR